MNKRIISTVMVLSMLFIMLVSAVPSYAATTEDLTITAVADKSTVVAGDTVTFTVKIGPHTDLLGLAFQLDIPDGLTYVVGSYKLTEDLKSTLGASSCEFYESTLFFLADAQYTSTSELDIMTFQCTVDADATGTLTLGFMPDENEDNYNHAKNLNLVHVPASVVVATPVTGVTLQETMSLKRGETKTLSFTVTPADATNTAVQFTSGNPEIATVDETTGAVTGVKKGTAIITVTTEDGGFTATCTVTVICIHGGGTATCQTLAVCEYCGESYGRLADHNPETEWTKDETGHWYKCKTEGCTEKVDFAAHTPDHEGGASEDYAVKCTECDYTIYERLEHTHVFDRQETTDTYKVCDATCQTKATYKYSCMCGEAGTETFEVGDYADHNPETEWTKDESGHWYACQTPGCTEKVDFAAHTPDHEGGASEDYAVKCTECDYTIYERLEHTHVFDRQETTDTYKVCDATCQKKATYKYSCKCGEAGTETFEVGDYADHNMLDATCTEPKSCEWCTYTEGSSLGHQPSDWKSDKDGHWKVCVRTGCGIILEEKTAHTDGNKDRKCDTCNYEVAVYRTLTFVINDGTGEVKTVIVAEGEEYELPANYLTAPKGMKFAGWIVNGKVYAEGAVIVINGDIEITPNWQKDTKYYDRFYAQLIMLHNKKYDIKASAGVGGTITPDGVSKVKFQRSITYTITPDAGYVIKAVIVDGENIGAVSEYSFKSVRGNHTIKVEFEAKSPYTDVNVNDWFYEEVLYVTEKDLMNGTGNGMFSPAVTTDRAMIVTVLWRLEGSPEIDGEIQFTDVEDGQWYADAIKWAAANAIVNGYGNDKFGPEKDITREQVMAILNRYADYKAYKDADAASATGYTYSEWAEENVAWAIANGLTDGLGVNVKDMTVKADRAEIAAYLARFVKTFID